MFVEVIKFIVYSGLIVLISKYILVSTLRKLAESLNLKPKTVGDVAGYATSMPELLTIGASSLNGLINASIINVVSSNVINLIQYLTAIFLNKNQKALKNKAIKVDIVLVIITIIIPIILIYLNIEVHKSIVPIFIILYPVSVDVGYLSFTLIFLNLALFFDEVPSCLLTVFLKGIFLYIPCFGMSKFAVISSVTSNVLSLWTTIFMSYFFIV